MDYSREYSDFREKTHSDFNAESIEIVLGLQRGDHRRVCAGVLAIYHRYQQLKFEKEQLEEKCKQLEKQLERCSEDLKAQRNRITPPAQRSDLETEELFRHYQESGSFRAVGQLFNCEGKTVKDRLQKGGYIV